MGFFITEQRCKMETKSPNPHPPRPHRERQAQPSQDKFRAWVVVGPGTQADARLEIMTWGSNQYSFRINSLVLSLTGRQPHHNRTTGLSFNRSEPPIHDARTTRVLTRDKPLAVSCSCSGTQTRSADPRSGVGAAAPVVQGVVGGWLRKRERMSSCRQLCFATPRSPFVFLRQSRLERQKKQQQASAHRG